MYSRHRYEIGLPLFSEIPALINKVANGFNSEYICLDGRQRYLVRTANIVSLHSWIKSVTLSLVGWGNKKYPIRSVVKLNIFLTSNSEIS